MLYSSVWTRVPGATVGWLQEQDTPALLGLLAVCVARTADAGRADWTTPHGAGTIQAQVATAAGLDMRQCWAVTKESYLARVPKALILDAVREGVGASAAARIVGTKKKVMTADAGALLAGTGWLPAVLRVPGVTYPVTLAAPRAGTPCRWRWPRSSPAPIGVKIALDPARVGTILGR